MAPADHFRAALGRADRLAAAVDRWSLVSLIALCGTYWFFAVTFAFRKLMWNDELYTFYIARLPTMKDVLGALLAGGEQTPPFFYLVTRTSLQLFGTNNISIRLPEILAILVMVVCLFAFVRRSASTLSALCAASFPLLTMAYPYAFEARPYGLVLGFGAAALIFWQAATLDRRRAWSLLALTVALAGAASSHYYGIFVVWPVACGEAVRTAMRRRLDPWMWAAIAISVVPLLGHLPLIKASAAYSTAFWSPPQWVNLPDFYHDLFEPAIVPVVAVLAVGVIVNVVTMKDATAAPDERSMLRSEELAAACGFVAIPLVCLLMAKFITGAFVNRYALASVLGFAVLAGFGAEVAFKRHPALRLAIVLCFGGWFVLSQMRELIEPTGATLPVSAAAIRRPAEWLDALRERDLPVVVADPHTFVELSHYAESDLKPRLVYAADPALALKHLGHNSVERGMVDLIAPWFGMRVVPFSSFMAEHRRFVVYGDFVRLMFLNWIVPELQARGMRTELLNRSADNMLLLVSPDGEATTAAPSSKASASVSRLRARADLRR